MNGIIVLEGPDCTGKSTLAKHFADKHGALYVHATWNSELDKVMWDYHLKLLHDAVIASKCGLVVMDRLWASEAIYGRVYRGGSKIPHEGRMLDRVLMRYGAVTVVCLANTPDTGALNIVESAKKRDEMWEAEGRAKLVDLCQRFHNLYHGVTYHGAAAYQAGDYAEFMAHVRPGVRRNDFLHYNFDRHGHNLPKFAAQVLERLGQRRQVCDCVGYLNYRNFNVVGSPEPETLIVGDRLNPKDPFTRWPFIEHGHSSLYLAKHLHNLRADETKIAYTNVNDDGGRAACEILSRINVKRVICLGKAAEKAIAATGRVQRTMIPHPSYARRFNVDYGTLLGFALAG